MKQFREDLISTYNLIRDKLSDEDKSHAMLFLDKVSQQYERFDKTESREPTFSLVEENFEYLLEVKNIELIYSEKRHILSRIKKMYTKIFIEEDIADIIHQTGVIVSMKYSPHKILWELMNLYMVVLLLHVNDPDKMDKLEKKFFKELNKISSIVSGSRTASFFTLIATVISYLLSYISSSFLSMSFHYGLLAIGFLLFSELYNVIRYRKTQTID